MVKKAAENNVQDLVPRADELLSAQALSDIDKIEVDAITDIKKQILTAVKVARRQGNAE